MMLTTLLVTAAQAGPLLIRFADPDRLAEPPLAGAVSAGAASAAFSPSDAGTPPDVHAGDSVYTVVVEAPDAPTVQVSLTDARGRVWSGEFERPAGLQPDLDLQVDAGGALRAYAPTVPGGEAEGKAGDILPASSHGAAALPWGVAAVGWGIAVAMLVERSRRRPVRAAGGREPTLPPGLHRRPVGSEGPGVLLEHLVREHRVVVLGTPPAAEYQRGDVFALPDRPRIGDVVDLVTALGVAGRPVAVLALTQPEHLEGVSDRALLDLVAMVPQAAVVVPEAG